MTRLAEIEGRIASMDELLEVVGAMRSLAGMRIQEAQHALPAVRRYADAMAEAIGSALLLMPKDGMGRPARQRRALILFTAEHGFVGGFNQMLMETKEAAGAPGDTLFVLGSRGAALAAEHGRKLTWARPMATRAASAPEAVRALTTELYRRIARNEISRVELVFARTQQAGPARVTRRTLLPLDLAPLARKRGDLPPLHALPPQELLERLVAEYVFALLTEAAIESLASENAARFSAMSAAHDNVGKKLDELRQAARQARQEEITSELLDLVTGAEAVAQG